MPSLKNRPSSHNIHTLILSLINQPGVLARVLLILQHNNVNVETVSVYPIDEGDISAAVLRIKSPRSRLELLRLKIERNLGVLQIEAVPSSIGSDPED